MSVSCSSAPALPGTVPSTVGGAFGGGAAAAPTVDGGGLTTPASTPAPTPDIGAAIAQVTTAIGAVQAALAAGAVSGGGAPAGPGCGCCAPQGAQAGSGALAAPEAPGPGPKQEPAQAPSQAPSPAPEPPAAPAHAAGSGTAPAGFKIHKPVDGYRISSHFGSVEEIRHGRAHGGTDLAIGANTPIKAAAAGKVVKVGWDPDGYGNYVTIDHGNGYFTRYAHMIEKPSVKEGETVDVDGQIGKVGSTGNSTGPHLHFEVLKGGVGPTNRLDAEPFLKGEKTF